MTTIPMVCPVAFGEEGTRMLELWLRAYQHSGSTFPVTVITDDPTTDTLGLPVAATCIEGMPHAGGMHRAGCIKISAFVALRERGHDGPVIAMDCDIIQVQPIDPLADVCCAESMAIAPDPREARWPWLPELQEEKNTGLIWLNSDEPYRMWRNLWPHYWHTIHQVREVTYSDEIVQSLIWQRMCGLELDRRWNLSHRQTELYDEASAVHFHGTNKDKMRQFMAERGLV